MPAINSWFLSFSKKYLHAHIYKNYTKLLKFNEILTIYTQYDILKLNKIFDGDIMKKKTIIIIVVAVLVVVLVGGGVVFYFKDVWFGNYGDSELGRYYGLFGYSPLTGK